MKQRNAFFVAALLLVASEAAMAQFTAGSRFIGGGIFLGLPVSQAAGKGQTYSAQLQLGRFRSPVVARGFELRVGREWEENTSARLKSSTNELAIGPFGQRYLPVVPTFGFVLTGRGLLSYKGEETRSTAPNVTTKATTTTLGLGLSGSPGMYFQPSPRWLLTLDLGSLRAFSLNRQTAKSASDVETTATSYSLNPEFSVGGTAIRVLYFLP